MKIGLADVRSFVSAGLTMLADGDYATAKAMLLRAASCLCPLGHVKTLGPGLECDTCRNRRRRIERTGHDRGIAPRSRIKCPQGHRYTEQNTRRDRQGHRHCRQCESSKWKRIQAIARRQRAEERAS